MLKKYNVLFLCNSFFSFAEFTKGMILPKNPKKDNVKENISNITSGFNVKVCIIYLLYRKKK